MSSWIKQNLANAVTTLGIISGIIACSIAIQNPSWILAEILFLFSLCTDACDGRMARKYGSTAAGPYLDDIADFINFGVHPGIWIWIISGEKWLTIVFMLCIGYRLIRFTLLKQETSTTFSGLPSPAAALGIFGLVFVVPSEDVFMVGVLFLSFLTVSLIRCMHVVKYQKFFTYRFPLLFTVLLMPILF